MYQASARVMSHAAEHRWTQSVIFRPRDTTRNNMGRAALLPGGVQAVGA